MVATVENVIQEGDIKGLLFGDYIVGDVLGKGGNGFVHELISAEGDITKEAIKIHKSEEGWIDPDTIISLLLDEALDQEKLASLFNISKVDLAAKIQNLSFLQENIHKIDLLSLFESDFKSDPEDTLTSLVELSNRYAIGSRGLLEGFFHRTSNHAISNQAYLNSVSTVSRTGFIFLNKGFYPISIYERFSEDSLGMDKWLIQKSHECITNPSIRLAQMKWITKGFIHMGKALRDNSYHGIIHRDIKPANIDIDTYDNPTLFDFGLASFNEESDPSGKIVGSPSYAAPEQIRGDIPTHKADLFSLFATYAMALQTYTPNKSCIDVVLKRNIDRFTSVVTLIGRALANKGSELVTNYPLILKEQLGFDELSAYMLDSAIRKNLNSNPQERGEDASFEFEVVEEIFNMIDVVEDPRGEAVFGINLEKMHKLIISKSINENQLSELEMSIIKIYDEAISQIRYDKNKLETRKILRVLTSTRENTTIVREA